MVQDAEALAANEQKILQIQKSEKFKEAEEKMKNTKKVADELGVDTPEEAEKISKQLDELIKAFDELNDLMKNLGIETKPMENQ